MPKSSSGFEQGDIVIAEFVFSNQSGAKRRPGLVISPARYNEFSEDIVLLKITSNLMDRPFSLKLSQKDLEAGELRQESVARIDFPVVVEKKLLTGRIGRVTEKYLDKVKNLTREFYALD